MGWLRVEFKDLTKMKLFFEIYCHLLPRHCFVWVNFDGPSKGIHDISLDRVLDEKTLISMSKILPYG